MLGYIIVLDFWYEDEEKAKEKVEELKTFGFKAHTEMDIRELEE